MKRVLLVILLLLFSHALFAQKYGHALTDSLLKELPNAKEDTNKVKLLDHLADCYYYNFDTSLYYATNAAALAEKLDWKKGTVERELGDAYYLHHNYPKGLECYFKALKICEEENDKESEADVLTQLVYLYNSSQDYAKALAFASRLLKLAEGTGNQLGICAALSLLEYTYRNMQDYPKALECLFKEMGIYEKIKSQPSIAATAKEIGMIYDLQKKYAKALEYKFMALRIRQTAHDTSGIKNVLQDIGDIYSHQDSDTTALEYYKRVANIDEDAGDSAAASNDYYTLIDVYLKLHNYAKALDYGFHILKNYQHSDSANVKYALGKMGMIYFRMATDSTIPARLSSGEKTDGLLKAKNYFIQSGLRPTLLVTEKTFSFTDDRNYYPQLIETEKLLGDYKGAFEHLEAAKAIADTEAEQKNKGLVGALEIKESTDELEKQEAVDRITTIKKRNEQVFYFVGLGLLLATVIVIYRNYRAQKKSNRIITKEKQRSDDLLLNILPAEVAEELKEKGRAAARHFDNVTVLFTDFVGFTMAGERMAPQQLVDELDACFKEFDTITGKYGIEKIKTIGDAYLAVSGLPIATAKHAENIVNAALEICGFMLQRKREMGDKTFEVRIGVHSGNVVAGIVGVKKFAYDIWGDTVNTAARMEQNSAGGKVNISQATYELVKDQFVCTYRGEIDAKNKGAMSMYFVERKMS